MQRPESEPTPHARVTAAVEAKVKACQEHARDLLRAARVLLSSERLPHLAYHLATLGLEELGKASLFVADSVVSRKHNSDNTELRHGDDHVRKLFWALWGPSVQRDAISQGQVTSLMEFATTIHERRLRGLYVSTELEDLASPRDHIDAGQCERLIAVLEAAIKVEENVEFKELSKEEVDDLDWFLDAQEDQERRRLLFGGPSLQKLAELGHPRAWIRWIREQFDKAQAEAKELAQRELARSTAPADAAVPKWRIRFRLYTKSHALRQKEFVQWNQQMSLAQLTMGDKKKGELIVDINLPKAVDIRALWFAGWGIARSFAVALNIGSQGFFWWYLPKDVSRYYERITDLEAGHECVVERSPALNVDWKGGVLTQPQLTNTAICLVEIVRLGQEEHQCLDRYIEGLTMLSKTDIHSQHEAQAFCAFYFSLKEATRTFGDCTDPGRFPEVFESVLATTFSTAETQSKFKALGALAEAQLSSAKRLEQITLTEAAGMKLAVDSYFVRKFSERVRARMPPEKPEPADPQRA